jgi:hypothetical protein
VAEGACFDEWSQSYSPSSLSPCFGVAFGWYLIIASRALAKFCVLGEGLASRLRTARACRNILAEWGQDLYGKRYGVELAEQIGSLFHNVSRTCHGYGAESTYHPLTNSIIIVIPNLYRPHQKQVRGAAKRETVHTRIVVPASSRISGLKPAPKTIVVCKRSPMQGGFRVLSRHGRGGIHHRGERVLDREVHMQGSCQCKTACSRQGKMPKCQSYAVINAPARRGTHHRAFL